MDREQNLRKYLAHLYTLGQEKFPRLLELFVKSGKEYAKQNDQITFIRILRVEINRNRGARVKQLIRSIYVFDSIIKDIKSFRQPVSHVIGQIFVQLFSIFFESNFQSEIEDMKMIRKSWATLLPDDILDNIQKKILSSYNYNLDKGFSKKKIDELTNYYTTKIKLTPEVYSKYLPSIENSKTNDIIQLFPEDEQEPLVQKKRKPIIQQLPTPSHEKIIQSSSNTYSIPVQNNYHPNYPGNYPTNQNYVYQVPMHYSQQLPIQSMQQNVQIKNPYYYPTGMPVQMNGYNNYYNPSINMYNGMNNHSGMSNHSGAVDKMNLYFDTRGQIQPKVKQRQQNKTPKQRLNSQYKELISFGRYRCPCCGMVSNRRDYFDLHLKSHFQQSKKDYDRLKKQTPIKRQPAANLEEWIPSQTRNSQTKYFVEIDKYPESHCKLCSNIFQPEWDSDLQKWVFKDVVLVDLDNFQKCSMHYTCFSLLNQESHTS